MSNAERCRRYHQTHRHVYAGHARKFKYGLTEEKFQELRKVQDECCAICKKKVETLCVDHDHSCCPNSRSCGKCIRGLLCDRCNVGLGRFYDNEELLAKAVAYIQKYKKRCLTPEAGPLPN